MSEKSVFRVTIVPSLLFLVSRFCAPPEVKFHVFWYIKTRGRKIAIEFFLLFLSVHWGDLIEQIKQNLSKLAVNYGQSMEMGPRSVVGIMSNLNHHFCTKTDITFFNLLRQNVVDIQKQLLCG